MRLVGYGPEGLVQPVGRAELHFECNRAEYRRDGLTMRDADGTTALRYSELHALDATGRELPGPMALRAAADAPRVALLVDVRDAVFPVVVDPLISTQVAKLTATDAAAADNCGNSVSTSGDTVVVGAPFDDENPLTYPGAAETNDGIDNPCDGDLGFGVVDENTGRAGFHSSDKEMYSWPAQPGAIEYKAMRSSGPGFQSDGFALLVVGPALIDPMVPILNGVSFYLVRSVAPNEGSWGAGSSGFERTVVCATGVVSFPNPKEPSVRA